MEDAYFKQNKLRIPKFISMAYPLLKNISIECIGKVASLSAPDQIYYIYIDRDTEKLYTCIVTDHPDPVHDSNDLNAMSGIYSFIDLVIPYKGGNYVTVQIDDNDVLSGNFFLKKANTYYYVARTQQRSI